LLSTRLIEVSFSVAGDATDVKMTSFPVARDVTDQHGVTLEPRILLLVVVLQFIRPLTGCILLLDGWSPMSVGERATLAEIVAVGVVRRTFKAQRTEDGAATYSAEVRITNVFKGHQLVDSVPYQHRSISGGIGNNSTSGVTEHRLLNSSGGLVEYWWSLDL